LEQARQEAFQSFNGKSLSLIQEVGHRISVQQMDGYMQGSPMRGRRANVNNNSDQLAAMVHESAAATTLGEADATAIVVAAKSDLSMTMHTPVRARKKKAAEQRSPSFVSLGDPMTTPDKRSKQSASKRQHLLTGSPSIRPRTASGMNVMGSFRLNTSDTPASKSAHVTPKRAKKQVRPVTAGPIRMVTRTPERPQIEW
jgi:hypothetical protein